MSNFKRFSVFFGFVSIMAGAVGSRAASFPLDLRGTVPEQASVTVSVNKPVGAAESVITLTAFDADAQKEGQLVINGNDPIYLFGASGVSAHNQKWVDVTISTPASYWKNGNNTLLFKHIKTHGYVVSGVMVSFGSATSNTSSPEPIVELSANSLDFGNQHVGGISDPLSVTLSNSGSAALDISSLYATSASFRQTNGCNNYLPSGRNCKINVTFIPTTSQNYSEKLTIHSNAAGSPHTVSLTGRGGDSGTQFSAGNFVLNVDFENRVMNSAYTDSQLIQDFNANRRDGAIHGPDWGNTRVVNDPAGTGRGNVLRVRHQARKYGSAASFKARFAPDNQNKKGSARFDDIYFAYDLYLSRGYKPMMMHKLPGLITGNLLEASHSTGVKPTPEGIVSFNARLQSYSSGVFKRRPFNGALTAYTYDAQKTNEYKFLDTVDVDGQHAEHSYTMPIGKWFTIEERVKLNTADSNDAYNSSKDKKDGLVEVWIDGKKMLSRVHLWRHTNTMKADGFWFTSYYNDTKTTRRLGQTPPPVDQYEYYDNFRVSTTPITH